MLRYTQNLGTKRSFFNFSLREIILFVDFDLVAITNVNLCIIYVVWGFKEDAAAYLNYGTKCSRIAFAKSLYASS